MNFTGLLFLLLTHFFTGKGVIRLFRVQLTPVATLCFSMLIGVFMASLVPCVQQMAHIPITTRNTYIGLAVMAGVFSIPLLINIRNTKMPKLVLPQLYELPFMLVFLGLATISVWRCYYLPVTPRDMLTGPELIAEFAVREHTMISSIFKVDLRMHENYANNIFKSPFITGLQIIYKQLVHPFGQQWLSVVFLSFTLWLYNLLRERIHGLLAGIIMLTYFAMPDVFAYSYLILYDYSNMVFFFASAYFIMGYLENEKLAQLIWASFLLGIATYIRTETLAFALMIAPLVALYQYRKKIAIKDIAIAAAVIVIIPVLFNFLCTNIFIKNFIPYTFKLSNLISHDLFNISLFFEKLTDISTKLMFAKKGEAVYAHFFFIFTGLLIADIIWPRKYNHEAKMSLWGIGIVYVGLAMLAFLIPSNTLENTTKRALFKLVPLMVLYMANSGIITKLSDFLKRRELAKTGGTPAPQPRPVQAAPPKPRPAPAAPKPQPAKGRKN